MDPDYNDIGESNVHGALIFQGGGSLDAYEAGATRPSVRKCRLL
jgi:hypothetical protein